MLWVLLGRNAVGLPSGYLSGFGGIVTLPLMLAAFWSIKERGYPLRSTSRTLTPAQCAAHLLLWFAMFTFGFSLVDTTGYGPAQSPMSRWLGDEYVDLSLNVMLVSLCATVAGFWAVHWTLRVDPDSGTPESGHRRVTPQLPPSMSPLVHDVARASPRQRRRGAAAYDSLPWVSVPLMLVNAFVMLTSAQLPTLLVPLCAMWALLRAHRRRWHHGGLAVTEYRLVLTIWTVLAWQATWLFDPPWWAGLPQPIPNLVVALPMLVGVAASVALAGRCRGPERARHAWPPQDRRPDSA